MSFRPLVLASASRSRAALLEGAGLAFEQIPSAVDEAAVKQAMRGSPPARIAARLAAEKARSVSLDHPGAIVIGADQMLALGEKLFDKPEDMAAARRHLQALRGREHQLIGALSVQLEGEERFSHTDEPRLVMRDFSDAFLDDYLARAGERVLESVGAYQLEGLGVQLFSRVEGDFFSILGLPLLPLLDFLRGECLLPA